MKTIVCIIACMIAVSTAQAQERMTADKLHTNFPAEIRQEMADWDKKLEDSKEARMLATKELTSARAELVSALAESNPDAENFGKKFSRFMSALGALQELNTSLSWAHADTLGMMLKSGEVAQPGVLGAFNKWVEGFNKELPTLPDDEAVLIKRGAELETQLLKNEMTRLESEDNLERERIKQFQVVLQKAAEENRRQC